MSGPQDDIACDRTLLPPVAEVSSSAEHRLRAAECASQTKRIGLHLHFNSRRSRVAHCGQQSGDKDGAATANRLTPAHTANVLDGGR